MENLPVTLDQIHDLPIAVRGIYEYDPRGYYRLSAGGTLLSQVRNAVREGYASQLKVSATVALPDWTNTVSAATPAERMVLLRLKAANVIRIK